MSDSEEQLNRVFSALADPVRRRMLMRLTQGEATVNELAEPFSMSVQAVSKHIKVLEQADLITRRRQAQTRPCSVNPATLQMASDWIEAHRLRRNEQFDRLEKYFSHATRATIQTAESPVTEEES